MLGRRLAFIWLSNTKEQFLKTVYFDKPLHSSFGIVIFIKILFKSIGFHLLIVYSCLLFSKHLWKKFKLYSTSPLESTYYFEVKHQYLIIHSSAKPL